MYKQQWILHIDLVSYDPKNHRQDTSVNMHISFDSEKGMHQAFMKYHSAIGEQFSIPDMFTILSVEPDLYPVLTETADDTDNPFDSANKSGRP